MSLKFLTCIFLCLFSFAFSFAQKVKINDGIAYVDDKEYVKVSKCGSFNSFCSLYNLQGKEIIYMSILEVPGDRYTYYKLSFLGFNKFIELRDPVKKIIKILYENSAITESGELNKERIDILVEKYGNSVTGNIRH
jgi:hypothetical protein